MKQHFLQSTAWEKFEQLEGRKTFRISGDGFSALAVLESTPLGQYLFCPYGPAIKEDNCHESKAQYKKNAIAALSSLAQAQGAFFVRLEPTAPFDPPEWKTLGLKKSHDIDPAHTWVLDLTRPESEIFADMEKEKSRLWRNHEKKGITIRQTKDPAEVSILSNLLKLIGSHNHFIPQKEAHLISQLKAGFATLYIAELDGEPIAASLVYDYDGVRYDHAASDLEHRKLAAGSILLVQMIVDAKHQGFAMFDFWGITTSADKTHPWYGFTQFKKSFGGQQMDYAGTWDLPLNPFRYHIYQIVRKLNRIRRKIFRKVLHR